MNRVLLGKRALVVDLTIKVSGGQTQAKFLITKAGDSYAEHSVFSRPEQSPEPTQILEVPTGARLCATGITASVVYMVMLMMRAAVKFYQLHDAEAVSCNPVAILISFVASQSQCINKLYLLR